MKGVLLFCLVLLGSACSNNDPCYEPPYLGESCHNEGFVCFNLSPALQCHDGVWRCDPDESSCNMTDMAMSSPTD
jgi:hypothetical protein